MQSTQPRQLPGLDGIRQAKSDLSSLLSTTPIVRSELLSRAFRADVWLKVETSSPIGSFKARGALTALLRAPRGGTKSGVVASSTGNHAQGVAWSARQLGIPSHIFLPKNPNAVKMTMTKAFGATVHIEGDDIEGAKRGARKHAKSDDLFFVDDGDNVDMMEGAGTVGLEIAEALDDVAAVYCPMGGGNLVSGIATAMEALQPEAKVIGVQSEGAPAMARSFHANRAIVDFIDTVADGLACRFPADLALTVMQKSVDDAITVTDDHLLSSVRTLIESAHYLVEPAGAAGLAGAWAQRKSLVGKRVVLVLTGANITTPLLEDAVAQPALFELEDLVDDE